MKPKVYILFGPTGSGKTARALDFVRAEAAEGRVVEIINADSRQIYKGLPVLAACPTAEEYAVCPHHLFEFLSLDEPYSAGRYAAAALRVMGEVVARGHIPLVVGGTGFYLRALEGIGDAPAVAVERLVDKFGDMSVDELGAKVREADPAWWAKANGSERRNPQRMMRVLGVAEETGRPLSDWQQNGERGTVNGERFEDTYEVVRWVQEVLADDLKTRLRARVEAGAAAMEAEVRAVLEAGVAADAPGLQALGFEVWAEVVRGERTMASAVEATVKLHADYAKRQRLWVKTVGM